MTAFATFAGMTIRFRGHDDSGGRHSYQVLKRRCRLAEIHLNGLPNRGRYDLRRRRRTPAGAVEHAVECPEIAPVSSVR